MKFLVFGGGLGNQIFEYVFYLYLKEKYPKLKIFGFYKIRLSGHNGLEINRRFDIKLPPSNLFSDMIVYLLYLLKRINPKNKIFDLGIDKCINEKAILYNALKQNKCYLPNDRNWIRFKIEENSLTEKNKKILYKIRNTNSYFIHIRRGDYITGKWAEYFKGTCPIEYYYDAIKYIKRNDNRIQFFCFSDDIEWVKENIIIEDAVYIDWNKKEESFMDMYLMSQCKGAIIANSTFSYWGAFLGKEKKNITYPKKWINGQQPDIFPDNWISL